MSSRPSRFRPGQRIDGHYHLEAFLARGSVSEIYSARHDAGQGELVVVKILSEPDARDTIDRNTRIGYFLREAAVTAQLEHPHIIDLLEVGYDATAGHFIVLEYLPGPSLKNYVLESGPTDDEEARHLAAQILSALALAHRNGILHRDLKPENVLLVNAPGEPVEVKLFDFGVAKVFDASAWIRSLTVDSALVGSPVWMSPEQCQGHDLDARSDLYSLGALLYFLVTGEPPFRAEDTLFNLLESVLNEEPRSIRELRASKGLPPLSATLRKCIRRAMSKDPEQRFLDIDHFLSFLDRDRRDATWSINVTVSQTQQGKDALHAPFDAGPPGIIAVQLEPDGAATEQPEADDQGAPPSSPRMVERLAPALNALGLVDASCIDHERDRATVLVPAGEAASVTALETALIALDVARLLGGDGSGSRAHFLVGVGYPTCNLFDDTDSVALLVEHLHDQLCAGVEFLVRHFDLGPASSGTGNLVLLLPEWAHDLRQDLELAPLGPDLHDLLVVRGARPVGIDSTDRFAAWRAESLSAAQVLDVLSAQHGGLPLAALEDALYFSCESVEVQNAVSELQARQVVDVDGRSVVRLATPPGGLLPPAGLPLTERTLLYLRLFSLFMQRRALGESVFEGSPDSDLEELLGPAEAIESAHRRSATRHWLRAAQRQSPEAALRSLLRALRLAATHPRHNHLSKVLLALASNARRRGDRARAGLWSALAAESQRRQA